MAKKNKSIVIGITNLTPTQASKMLSAITKAKAEHSPKARGTCAYAKTSEMSKYLDTKKGRSITQKR